MQKKSELYQTVIITLTNGKKGTFLGPVLVTEKDTKLGINIVYPIQFTAPTKVPAGYYFSQMEKEDGKTVAK